MLVQRWLVPRQRHRALTLDPLSYETLSYERVSYEILQAELRAIPPGTLVFLAYTNDTVESEIIVTDANTRSIDSILNALREAIEAFFLTEEQLQTGLRHLIDSVQPRINVGVARRRSPAARRPPSERRRDARALDFLYRTLSTEEKERFEERDIIDVRGSNGGLWRILPRRFWSGRLVCLEPRTIPYCCHAESTFHPHDAAAGLVAWVKTDEHRVVELANPYDWDSRAFFRPDIEHVETLEGHYGGARHNLRMSAKDCRIYRPKLGLAQTRKGRERLARVTDPNLSLKHDTYSCIWH